jgi:hypothetical protein
MKINIQPRVNVDAETTRYMKEVAQQVNGVSEGRIAAFYNATTAVPTTGTYTQGDFVPNKTPSELGTAGSKYVIEGWTCVVSGTPGTWVQKRFLTGN